MTNLLSSNQSVLQDILFRSPLCVSLVYIVTMKSARSCTQATKIFRTLASYISFFGLIRAAVEIVYCFTQKSDSVQLVLFSSCRNLSLSDNNR